MKNVLTFNAYGGIAVSTPYNAGFVQAIKKLEQEDRTWIKPLRMWIVRQDCQDYVRNALRTHYNVKPPRLPYIDWSMVPITDHEITVDHFVRAGPTFRGYNSEKYTVCVVGEDVLKHFFSQCQKQMRHSTTFYHVGQPHQLTTSKRRIVS